MSNFENLTSKILEDGKNKSKEIIDVANKEAEMIINTKVKEAEHEKDKIIYLANREAKVKKERVISNAQLKVRNNKLEAKQKMINNVFQKAIEKLNNLSEDKYIETIKNIILLLPIDGDEKIIIGEKDKNIFNEKNIEDINNALKENNKKGDLKLGEIRNDIEGGFVLSKNGIEINCTFKALVDSSRDEFEYKIVETLFN